MTAVDRAGDGYTLSKTALNTLTCVELNLFSLSDSFADAGCSNNQADWAGAVDGIAAEVPKALCGLK